MTKQDMTKLKEGSRALGLVLLKDERENDSSVKLEPAERQYIQKAQMGLIETLRTAQQNLEQKLNTIKRECEEAQDPHFNLQLEMFGSNGRPTTPVDDNGKVIPTKRVDDPHPDDGEQGELEESEEPSENPEEAAAVPEDKWQVAPGIPAHVEAAILQQVAKGSTKTEATKSLASECGLTRFEVVAFFDQLVAAGKIAKQGKAWVVATGAEPKGDEPEAKHISQILDREEAKHVSEIILYRLTEQPLSTFEELINWVCEEYLYTKEQVQIRFHEMVSEGRLKLSGSLIVVEDQSVSAQVEKELVKRVKEDPCVGETELLASTAMSLGISEHSVQMVLTELKDQGGLVQQGGVWMADLNDLPT